MVRSIVNEKFEFNIEKTADQIRVNGMLHDFDIAKTDDSSLHIILENKSFNARLISRDQTNKKFEIKINRHSYTVELRDEADLLIEKAGITKLAKRKIDALLAPMPGLILDIKVKVGQHVKTGDPLIVLKAMKMENILKSPHDGVISEILAEKNQKIEKDFVIIQF